MRETLNTSKAIESAQKAYKILKNSQTTKARQTPPEEIPARSQSVP